MADYDVITYRRPDGQIINLSDPPYMTNEYDGFGIGEFSHTTVAPPQLHGEYVYGTRMEAKILTVDFSYTGDGVNERDASRREVVRMFNPLLGPGVLRIDQVNGISREITCILAESLPLPSSEFVGTGHYRTIVRFKSHGIPAFIDPLINVHNLNFNTTPGNFMFPWSFPRTFAQSGFASNPILTNDGDIETPIRVEIDGPLIDPIFRNNTSGQEISLAGLTVTEDQTLVIDTDPEQYIIQVDGTDVWQYVNKSEMWGLVPGENDITLDIGGTSVDSVGTIKWYSRYLGQ